MDLDLLKKELNYFMKWVDRNTHSIPNEDWMNEQNVDSYMDSIEFKKRAWADTSNENSGLHLQSVSQQRELLLKQMSDWLMTSTTLSVEAIVEFQEKFKQ